MVEYTKQFARIGQNELSLDERNILSVAFKNIVGTRRATMMNRKKLLKTESRSRAMLEE